MITEATPTGTLAINDLDLAGLVLGFLVLEKLCSELQYKNIGSFCNNLSTVLWSNKGIMPTSIAAAQLLELMYIQHRVLQTSSLIQVSITGKDNAMDDILSSELKMANYFMLKLTLSLTLTCKNALPQNISLYEFRLNPKLMSRVISFLHGEALKMESLYRMTNQGGNIFRLGPATEKSATLKPNLTLLHPARGPPPSPALQTK